MNLILVKKQNDCIKLFCLLCFNQGNLIIFLDTTLCYLYPLDHGCVVNFYSIYIKRTYFEIGFYHMVKICQFCWSLVYTTRIIFFLKTSLFRNSFCCILRQLCFEKILRRFQWNFSYDRTFRRIFERNFS